MDSCLGDVNLISGCEIGCLFVFMCSKLKNHHPDAGDMQPQVGMQRKKSLERLHNNGDVPHGGWNEHVAGSVNCTSEFNSYNNSNKVLIFSDKCFS